jgi:hypothetical protein
MTVAQYSQEQPAQLSQNRGLGYILGIRRLQTSDSDSHKWQCRYDLGRHYEKTALMDYNNLHSKSEV